jgi:hypothetical protein
MQKKYLWGLGLVAVLAVGAVAVGNGHFLGYKLVHHGMDGAHHGAGQGHMHGADGTGHDEVNMPGLRGENATPEESAELAVMFRNFQTLSREVTELPNGIRTVTRSSDPDVMENLVSHVTGMIGRVETANDPKIPIQSPTLDIFFARGDKITTDIDVTDEGIVVVQTSDDPEVVKALHIHAGEVSDMADRGMAAVHEMMMKRASGN